MERMQSTWENLVDYDMSESGVRPQTLRELVAMGFDLDAFSISRSVTASRTAPSSCASGSPRATRAPRVDHIEVTNGTSEANYLIALSQLRPGDDVAMEVPNYMQMPASRAASARPSGRSSSGRTRAGSRTGTSSSTR